MRWLETKKILYKVRIGEATNVENLLDSALEGVDDGEGWLEMAHRDKWDATSLGIESPSWEHS